MATTEQLLVELQELRSALVNKEQLFAAKEAEFARERDKLNTTISELTQNIASLSTQVQSLIGESKVIKKRRNASPIISNGAVGKNKSLDLGISAKSVAIAKNITKYFPPKRVGSNEHNLTNEHVPALVNAVSANDVNISESNNSNSAECLIEDIETENNDADNVDMGSDDPEGCWKFVSHKNKKLGKEKIPPIQVSYSKDGFSVLYQRLTRAIGANQFTLDPKGNGLGARIYPAGENQHLAITKLLADNGYEFHTYLTSANKRKCFIVRGINSSSGFTCSELCDELIRAGLPESSTVIKYETGHMRANSGGVHLYKVLVPALLDESIFKMVRSVFGIGVSFTKFVSKAITQCSNCQSYFHTAAACHRKHRCVKCISDHPFGQCPKNVSPDSKPQCINCAGFHTANNQVQCDYFIKTIQPIIAKKSSVAGNSGAKIPLSNDRSRSVNGGGSSVSSSKANNLKTNVNNHHGNLVGSSSSTAGVSYAKVTAGGPSDMDKFFDLFSKMLDKQDAIIKLLSKNAG